MGKDINFVVISGFTFSDNNRGTSALSYGAVTFLQEKNKIKVGQTIVSFGFKHSLNLLKSPVIKEEKVDINGQKWIHKKYILSFIEQQIIKRLPCLIPLTRIAKIINKAEYVAAINGGDGFADIYGPRTFDSRLPESIVAIKMKRPLILLPQTLGPFSSHKEYMRGISILKKAQKIYIRDLQFVDELRNNEISYSLAKDLSCYMMPENCKIKILGSSIGLNVSGLCYYNSYGPLSGRFDYYPKLITEIISAFQNRGIYIFLIPHSYNFVSPEAYNDDLKACRDIYAQLKRKDHVTLIDGDFTPPQLKYIISKMSFFIGTRMHSNFAAIYTNTPVFGLSYSYKFEGAFRNNNVPLDHLANILDMKATDINHIIENILHIYKNSIIINKCQNLD